MMKRKIVIVAITALVVFPLVLGVTGVTANAQENATNETNATTTQEIQRDLGNGLVVRDISWDFENSTIAITMFSPNSESVTVTDALITEERTEPLNRQSYIIDGETVIRFNAETYNSKMAITIDANGQLHPFLKSDSLIDFTQNYTPQQVILSVIFGGVLGSGVVLVISYRKKIKTSAEIEKVT